MHTIRETKNFRLEQDGQQFTLVSKVADAEPDRASVGVWDAGYMAGFLNDESFDASAVLDYGLAVFYVSDSR